MRHAILRSAAIIVAHAAVGWAICGALIGVGRRFLSMDTTLAVHAIGAPLAFAALSWHYHRRYAFTQPLVTAGIFVGVVLCLDLLVVATLIERDFAMFRSFVGTWLPMTLIFAATWWAGQAQGRARTSAARSVGG